MIRPNAFPTNEEAIEEQEILSALSKWSISGKYLGKKGWEFWVHDTPTQVGMGIVAPTRLKALRYIKSIIQP